jgi:DNA-binding LytR/AlgR family response regulator
MRVLVVDDEQPARRRLRRMLERIDGVEVVGEAADGIEALARIDGLRPDVVLLDIDMPELDGVTLARRLAAGSSPTSVIFTTAHAEHAVEAFELKALDYLLKPIKHDRLAAALQRVEARGPAELVRVARAVAEAMGQRATTPRISARHGDSIHVFDARDIARFFASDKYTVFHHEGTEYVLDQPLAALETRLAAHEFFRVHRGELVNLTRVRALHTGGEGGAELELDDGQRVPVSRRLLPALRERLGA